MAVLSVLAPYLVIGLVTGAIYALIALGFTLVFNASKVLNFAQGEFLMLGAVLTSRLVGRYQLPYWVAFLACIALGIIIGLAMERISIRPLQNRGAGLIVLILATLATSIMISAGTLLTVGFEQNGAPPLWSGGPLPILGVNVGRQHVVILIFTAVAMAGFSYFYSRTPLGMAMRATGYGRDAAALMGVNIKRVVVLSFVLTASLAAVSGMLIVPIIPASTQMGLPLAIKGFIAAVLGGIQSPLAATFGGIVLGVIEALVAGYVSTRSVDILTFVLLLVLLLLRPSGLFASEQIAD